MRESAGDVGELFEFATCVPSSHTHPRTEQSVVHPFKHPDGIDEYAFLLGPLNQLAELEVTAVILTIGQNHEHSLFVFTEPDVIERKSDGIIKSRFSISAQTEDGVL